MGTLAYGSPEHLCTIDDRVLAHVQIVIIDKLRHGEHFAFSFDAGDIGAPATLWMSPCIPLRFEFADHRKIEINRGWLHALERAARSVSGLRVVPEPPVLRALPTGPPVRELADA